MQRSSLMIDMDLEYYMRYLIKRKIQFQFIGKKQCSNTVNLVI